MVAAHALMCEYSPRNHAFTDDWSHISDTPGFCRHLSATHSLTARLAAAPHHDPAAQSPTASRPRITSAGSAG